MDDDAGGDTYYLYHIRDPFLSDGWGFDGYVGITKDFKRRRREHFHELARGTHSNRAMQAAHDASENGLQMVLVATGPEHEILARERLFAHSPNRFWNRQVGGGPDRAMSEDDARERLWGNAARHDSPEQDDATTSASGRSGAAGAGAAGIGGIGAGAAEAFGDAAGAAAQAGRGGILAGAGLAAAGLAVATGVTGVGAAYAMNKTVLKDDPSLAVEERQSRRAGRVAGVVGGVAGAAATVAGVGAAGTVTGLSTAGVVSGVAVAGLGSVTAGTVVVLAAPAVAAVAAGYWIYRGVRWFKRTR
jgi:hypothetical protein